jgi:hypothetical protein
MKNHVHINRRNSHSSAPLPHQAPYITEGQQGLQEFVRRSNFANLELLHKTTFSMLKMA